MIVRVKSAARNKWRRKDQTRLAMEAMEVSRQYLGMGMGTMALVAWCTHRDIVESSEDYERGEGYVVRKRGERMVLEMRTQIDVVIPSGMKGGGGYALDWRLTGDDRATRAPAW